MDLINTITCQVKVYFSISFAGSPPHILILAAAIEACIFHTLCYKTLIDSEEAQ